MQILIVIVYHKYIKYESSSKNLRMFHVKHLKHSSYIFSLCNNINVSRETFIQTCAKYKIDVSRETFSSFK